MLLTVSLLVNSYYPLILSDISKVSLSLLLDKKIYIVPSSGIEKSIQYEHGTVMDDIVNVYPQ